MDAKDSEPSEEVKMDVVSNEVLEVLLESIVGSAAPSGVRGDPVLLERRRGACVVSAEDEEGAVDPRAGVFLWPFSSVGDVSAAWGDKSLGCSFGTLGGGLTVRSGWALTNARKLGSVLASGIFQGNRLSIMHRKMMAQLQTSVFRGS